MQDALAGFAKPIEFPIEAVCKQTAVALLPFTRDHDAINIPEARMHYDGGNGIVHRLHVDRGRVDDDEVGLLAGDKRTDRAFHAEHAGAFNRGPGEGFARRNDVGTALLVIEGALHFKTDAGDGEHFAGDRRFDIDTKRRRCAAGPQAAGDGKAVAHAHLDSGSDGEVDAEGAEAGELIVGKAVAMDDVDVRPEQMFFLQALPALGASRVTSSDVHRRNEAEVASHTKVV